MKRLKANVISLNAGKAQELIGSGASVQSAIVKKPVGRPVFLSTECLEGDEQADLRNHGGPDKAVCVYPYDHYPFWEDELGMKLKPGAFGENLTVKGLVEKAVHIGDVFQWGEAQVQVSQPRKPCHKLGKLYNEIDLPARVIEMGYSGFYFRVIKEGMVSEEEPLQFIKRYSDVSVSFVNDVYYEKPYDESAIEEVIHVRELAESWREQMMQH